MVAFYNDCITHRDIGFHVSLSVYWLIVLLASVSRFLMLWVFSYGCDQVWQAVFYGPAK